MTDAFQIYLAALAVRVNAPSDVKLLLAGVRHLRGWERATVEQAAESIIVDFKTGELEERIP